MYDIVWLSIFTYVHNYWSRSNAPSICWTQFFSPVFLARQRALSIWLNFKTFQNVMCSVAHPHMYRGSNRVFFKSFRGIAILKDCPSRLNEPPVTRSQELTSPFVLHLGMRACFYEDTVGNASFVSSALIIACIHVVGCRFIRLMHFFFGTPVGTRIFCSFQHQKQKEPDTLPDFCEAVSREMM